MTAIEHCEDCGCLIDPASAHVLAFTDVETDEILVDNYWLCRECWLVSGL